MRLNFFDDPVRLTDAAKLFPGRPHKNTVRRWCEHGYNGVRLKHFRAGKVICTTRRDIEEFLAAINPNYQPAEPAVMTREHEAATTKLDAMGV